MQAICVLTAIPPPRECDGSLTFESHRLVLCLQRALAARQFSCLFIWMPNLSLVLSPLEWTWQDNWELASLAWSCASSKAENQAVTSRSLVNICQANKQTFLFLLVFPPISRELAMNNPGRGVKPPSWSMWTDLLSGWR